MFLKSDTYLKSDSNKEQQVIKKKITVEDTLELLFVRYGRDMLDKEIEIIFGKEEKTADGQEKEITLTEFFDKVRKKDFNERKRLEEKRKTVDLPVKDDTFY